MTANLSSRFSRLRMAAAAFILMGLAACASPFQANVSRFQSQLPPPSGQTFTVIAEDPALAGGIEFSQYAALVEKQMAAQGYSPVDNMDDAQLVVRFDYGVDNGRERIRTTGRSHYPGYWGSWYGYSPYWGHPWRTGMWHYGWYDPWFDNGIDAYTVYTSGIDLKIDRRADGARLFEGKAEAVSTSNQLQNLVPSLIEAMFTGFPGNSGETVRITIAPDKTTTVKPVK